MILDLTKKSILNSLKVFFKDKGYRHIIVFSILFTIFINFPVFLVYLKIYRNIWKTTYSFCTSIIATIAFFTIFSINKNLFKILTFLLFFISSIVVFFIISYEFKFDSNIYGLVFETNRNEAFGLIGWEFYIFALSVASIILIGLKKINFLYSVKIKQLLAIFIIFVTLMFLSKIIAENYFFPYAYVTAYLDYIESKSVINKEREDIAKLGFKELNQSETQDLKIIFVLGESARPDHFHINGYSRETSPNIEKYKMINFTNVYTPFTVTRHSVPFILTRGRCSDDFKSALVNNSEKETSFISIFNKAGYRTRWISNQQAYHKFVNPITALAKESFSLDYADKFGDSMVNRKHLDEELFPYFDKYIKEDNELRSLYVIHTVGSHWNYNTHYTDEFKIFTPIAESSLPKNNSLESIKNSYDNSILYTDFFLGKLIERIKDLNAVLIYISDHGESLGEDGYYSHIPNSGRIEQMHTSMFIWASEKYLKYGNEKIRKAMENKDKLLCTDSIFPSILDAAFIDFSFNESKKSVFSDF